MEFEVDFNDTKYCSPQNYERLNNVGAEYDYYGDEETSGAFYIHIETMEELQKFCEKVDKEFEYAFSTIISFNPNEIFLTHE